MPVPTFTRASVAYKQDGSQVASGVPRYESGKYGQAIMVEEGTTNLLTANQSSLETDTAGWAVDFNCTLARSTDWASVGAASLLVTRNGTGDGYFSSPLGTSGIPASPGTSYVASFDYKLASGAPLGDAFFKFFDAAGVLLGDYGIQSFTPTATKQRKVISAVAPANTAFVAMTFRIDVPSTAAYYLDALQIEAKAYATSWQIGGTARNTEVLTVPSSVLNAAEGTIEGWVYVNDTFTGSGTKTIFQHNGTGTYVILRYQAGSDYWESFAGGSQAQYVATPTVGWHHFAVTWSGSTHKLYLDGIERASHTTGTPLVVNPANALRLGGDDPLNSLIDDLRISNVARTAQEVAAVAGSGRPAPVD